MNIQIQFVNMPTSESLQQNIEQKLSKLFDRFSWVVGANVYIKKENDPTGKGNICEIELRQSGPVIFASSNEENYHLSVKNTFSDLKKILEKRKQIMKPHL
ncbi:30S ribosomal protein S30 [Tenacibaculum holothuriorum]|uniref:30S ribosomal protein S30 n=1 Tax=Tenacibaculum holothuriorum TaxID=1635173 RepID=A0A1Y2PHL3_9FLAO|nr:HPF/RaiA family ribosome-associated protein [Tenacibaculum holothuriorum]OSY89277.1 30S ribosomal protein S30 [Tenacibaculum holothuriorum]